MARLSGRVCSVLCLRRSFDPEGAEAGPVVWVNDLPPEPRSAAVVAHQVIDREGGLGCFHAIGQQKAQNGPCGEHGGQPHPERQACLRASPAACERLLAAWRLSARVFSIASSAALLVSSRSTAATPSRPERAYLIVWRNKRRTSYGPECCRYMTTFSAGNLKPRPSDTRSALTGYFGLLGLMATMRNSSSFDRKVRP